MKSPQAPPKVPVAVTCTCGKKIVLEPRWVGKPTGCAGCGRDFVVRMLLDPKTGRWTPSVSFTPTLAPAAVKPGADGRPEWLNVACECGHKIGLVGKFLGHNMVCKACGREFIVRMVTKSDGKDTAVIRYSEKRKAVAEVIDPDAKKPEPEKPKSEVKKPETAKTKVAPPPRATRDKMPAPPGEFHLLCSCGEELVVEKAFYDSKMFCAGCGALMMLRLIWVPDRSRYELEARYLEAPVEGDA